MRPFEEGLCLLILTSFWVGCAAKNNNSSEASYPTGLPNGTTLPVVTGPNVMKVSVNGSLCSSGSYANKPCVSVSVCVPGSTTNCQTISDILLDTGSYGLRVFKSVLNADVLSGLTAVTIGAQSLAECVHFGDGSKDWGPVETADVVLGGESAVTVPIQVIDSTFANPSTYCSNAETSPASAGFNGILGVGLLPQDCGSTCAQTSSNGQYFTCTGSTCAPAAVPIWNQVQNPVSVLPVDNNGVILELPLIPYGGKSSADGYLVLGIGTQSNNVPKNVSVYEASDTTGDMTTVYNGSSYTSFIDSGSNGLFFSIPLPDCGTKDSHFSGWFCPSQATDLSAVNTGTNDVSNPVSFEIGNAIVLAKTGSSLFVELGGKSPGTQFDWGLPFFYGRNVYVAFTGASTSIGTGPYWAY